MSTSDDMVILNATNVNNRVSITADLLAKSEGTIQIINVPNSTKQNIIIPKLNR